MLSLIIGNAISLVAAAFTAASGWTDDRSQSFHFQTAQCLLLAVASGFFHSYAGISTLLLCAARNALIARERFTKPLCVLFVVLVGAVGLAVNNRGIIGLIPVGCTVLYTVLCYTLKSVKGTKWNILINQLLWVVYELVIFDFVSVLADGIGGIVTAAALVRLHRED